MPGVSVTVITLNEAANIEACLASVAWADEVLVVDSGSTDGTPDLARARGARVIVRDWPGYPARRTSRPARRRTTGSCPWTPTNASRRNWRRKFASTLSRDPREAGFRMPRVTWHLGRWIRTTDWYPDYQLRLYHRARATWPPRLVHESVSRIG